MHNSITYFWKPSFLLHLCMLCPLFTGLRQPVRIRIEQQPNGNMAWPGHSQLKQFCFTYTRQLVYCAHMHRWAKSRPQSTYIYRVQSSVWRLTNYWPPHPLSTQRVCPPLASKAGGYTLAGRWGRGWEVIISEDARHWIGLLQYDPSTVPTVRTSDTDTTIFRLYLFVNLEATQYGFTS